MCSLANNETPEEMPHDVAFHKDLHCLLLQKQFLEKEEQFHLENNTLTP